MTKLRKSKELVPPQQESIAISNSRGLMLDNSYQQSQESSLPNMMTIKRGAVEANVMKASLPNMKTINAGGGSVRTASVESGHGALPNLKTLKDNAPTIGSVQSK